MVLVVVVMASLIWVGMLHQKVSQQTGWIRNQRDVEAALKERYQDLFENANDMVYTHDLNGQMTSINIAGENLLGCKRTEINRKNFLDFIAEERASQRDNGSNRSTTEARHRRWNGISYLPPAAGCKWRSARA